MIEAKDYIIVNGKARYSLGYSDLEDEALFFTLYKSKAQLIMKQCFALGQSIWFYLDTDDFLISLQFKGRVIRCQNLDDESYSVDIELDEVKQDVIEMLKTHLLKKAIR